MRFLSLTLFVLLSLTISAQDIAAYTQPEVIYGRKDGMALTMQVLQPKRSVNRAIVNIISGQWNSVYSPNRWKDFFNIYLSKGYTLFNVVHGSQPRYSVADAAADIKRAVQFIRYNANNYRIDPDRIGAVGLSSGGQLALLAGLADNEGNPLSADSVSRMPGKVQAVACFNPPTDFLNWGAPGVKPLDHPEFLVQMRVAGAFQFNRFDSTKRIYIPIKDAAAIDSIARQLSPAWQVSTGDAPVMIWHGDADEVVPLQQVQLLKQKLDAAGVPCVLKVKKGAGHEWPDMLKDEADFPLWFDAQLKVKRAAAN